MSADEMSEIVTIALSRQTREAIDKHTRWHLALLDAGISEAEAHDIITDTTTELEIAA